MQRARRLMLRTPFPLSVSCNFEIRNSALFISYGIRNSKHFVTECHIVRKTSLAALQTSIHGRLAHFRLLTGRSMDAKSATKVEIRHSSLQASDTGGAFPVIV